MVIIAPAFKKHSLHPHVHDKIKICKDLNKIWSRSDWSSAETVVRVLWEKQKRGTLWPEPSMYTGVTGWFVEASLMLTDINWLWSNIQMTMFSSGKLCLFKLYDPKTCLIFFKHHAFVVLPQLLNYYLQSRPVNTDNICCINKIRILQRRPQTAQQLNSCTSQQLLTEMLADYPVYWCCSYNNRGVQMTCKSLFSVLFTVIKSLSSSFSQGWFLCVIR